MYKILRVVKVSSLGFRVEGLFSERSKYLVKGLGFGVWGLGFILREVKVPVAPKNPGS